MNKMAAQHRKYVNVCIYVNGVYLHIFKIKSNYLIIW